MKALGGCLFWVALVLFAALLVAGVRYWLHSA